MRPEDESATAIHLKLDSHIAAALFVSRASIFITL
jgi:hypothetical protein